jgi:hypothetical protein
MSRGVTTSPEMAALQLEARRIIRRWPAMHQDDRGTFVPVDRDAHGAAARALREVNLRIDELRAGGSS